MDCCLFKSSPQTTWETEKSSQVKGCSSQILKRGSAYWCGRRDEVTAAPLSVYCLSFPGEASAVRLKMRQQCPLTPHLQTLCSSSSSLSSITPMVDFVIFPPTVWGFSGTSMNGRGWWAVITAARKTIRAFQGNISRPGMCSHTLHDGLQMLPDSFCNMCHTLVRHWIDERMKWKKKINFSLSS